YGPFSHESDAEVIEFVASFFKRLGLNVAIEINDRQIMEQYIRKRLGISNESAILELFRAIDKVPKKGAQAVLQEYRDSLEPAKLRSLIELSKTRGSVDHVSSATDMKDIEGWQRLVDLMDSLASRKVQDVHINLGIVRGLDYYSGVVFEAFDKLADSGALVGGGRYDRLTEAFGRKDIGATGVAGGVERIVMALRKHGIVKGSPRPLVYVAYATENERTRAVELVTTLRSAGTTTDYDLHGRALRRQLDDASNKGAMLTVIVTELEFAAGQVVVRQMRDGTENKYRISTLPQEIAKILRA
ncbi:MAG: ATP phosphoribosyltransferase regulatory subunit, partial [Nitrososphaera sp.]